MKPLAIFAGVVVVGLAVIAAALHLTDHSASATPAPSAPTPLTRAQFVHSANAICERSLRESKAKGLRHPKITNLRTLLRVFRLGIPLFEKEAAGVRALIPPRSDAVAFRRLARNLGVAQRNGYAMLHAIETRQIRRAFLLAKREDVLDKRLNAESRKLGLTVCAKS